MAVKLPIVFGPNGQLQQLQAGDTLPAAPAVVLFSQVEVDFGATPVRSASFALADATVLATSKISAWQAGDAATGRQADENEMDQLRLVSRATGIGTWSLYAAGAEGPVSGKFKINYLVG